MGERERASPTLGAAALDRAWADARDEIADIQAALLARLSAPPSDGDAELVQRVLGLVLAELYHRSAAAREGR